MRHEVTVDLLVEWIRRCCNRERVSAAVAGAGRAVSIDDRKPKVVPHLAVRHAAMENTTGVVEGTPSVAEFRCAEVPCAVLIAEFNEQVNGRMEIARVAASAVRLSDVVGGQRRWTDVSESRKKLTDVSRAPLVRLTSVRPFGAKRRDERIHDHRAGVNLFHGGRVARGRRP